MIDVSQIDDKVWLSSGEKKSHIASVLVASSIIFGLLKTNTNEW